MFDRIAKVFRAMELEEKVFHAGVLLTFASLYLPWLSTGGYAETASWENGFGFRTGFAGHAVALIDLFLLAVTLFPLCSHTTLVPRSKRHVVRLYVSSAALLTVVLAFTVLLRVTFEISGSEVRFGVYTALLGSALSAMYAFLGYQDVERRSVRELFHHPDDAPPSRHVIAREAVEPQHPSVSTPPPPPPVEDHRHFSPPSS